MRRGPARWRRKDALPAAAPGLLRPRAGLTEADEEDPSVADASMHPLFREREAEDLQLPAVDRSRLPCPVEKTGRGSLEFRQEGFGSVAPYRGVQSNPAASDRSREAVGVLAGERAEDSIAAVADGEDSPVQ